jgi:hypothetical protein
MKPLHSLGEILTDHRLASLGDAYVNFAYSLALSEKQGYPKGTKVKGTVLAEALKKAGLREHLPSKMTSHKLADAAEALIIYGWLNNHMSLQESVTILKKPDDPIEGFAQLLEKTRAKIKLS